MSSEDEAQTEAEPDVIVEPAVAPAASGPAKAFDPSTLLAALAGGNADPVSLILSQLGGQTSDNPAFSMLKGMLEQRRQSATVETTSEDCESVAASSEAARQHELHLQELKDTVEKVYAELEALRARNDTLAAALGACFLCFGAEASCVECAGRGYAGARMPELSAYREFVLPAVRRVQSRGVQAAHTTAFSQSTSRVK
jgi:hypothetical protein